MDCLFLAAHGLLSRPLAAYTPILPGVGEMMFVLKAAKVGMRVERWFALVGLLLAVGAFCGER